MPKGRIAVCLSSDRFIACRGANISHSTGYHLEDYLVWSRMRDIAILADNVDQVVVSLHFKFLLGHNILS